MSHRYPWTYQKARHALFTRLLDAGVTLVPCAWCGRPVDLTHTGRGRAARSLDHTIPLSRGGRLLGDTRIVHVACNGARGNRPPRPARPEPQPSRDW